MSARSFVCRNEALDRYLRTQATQDIRRRIASVSGREMVNGMVAALWSSDSSGSVSARGRLGAAGRREERGASRGRTEDPVPVSDWAWNACYSTV